MRRQRRVTDLDDQPGIGRGLAAELRAVGVRDLAALRELGPAEVAARLAEMGLRDEAQVRTVLEHALGGAADAPRPPLPVRGVHAVVLTVGDLDAAVAHYAAVGLPVHARHGDPPSAVLRPGAGGPVLVLREDRAVRPAPPAPTSVRVWLAVPDARDVEAHLRTAGLATSAAAGGTVEVADRWGNVLGFTDAQPPG
jgi:hypothetical protein